MYKKQEKCEMYHLEHPEHSLLNLWLTKVVSQDPVSGLVEHRKGVQAIGIPVAVVSEGTFTESSINVFSEGFLLPDPAVAPPP